jgi:hypothetical protein
VVATTTMGASDGLWPYVVAGAVALLIGGVEQADRLRSPPTLRNRAVFWWGWRLLLEFGIGVVAVAIIRASDETLGHHPLTWVAAGAVGPAAARLRVADLEKRPIGVATAYEPLRGFIEGRLDKRSAEQLTSWLNMKILPRLLRANPEPTTFAEYVIDYVNGLGTMEAPVRRTEITWLQGVPKDETLSPAGQLQTLARHIAIELRAYRVLERYVKDIDPAK